MISTSEKSSKLWVSFPSYILDQKYSQRYKKSPFGTKAARFAIKKEVQEKKTSELSMENTPHDRSMTRTFIDETIEKIKQDESRKTSYQFKSGSQRFVEMNGRLKNSMFLHSGRLMKF